MSFTDHKIMEFTHKITDLPDEPTLSPQELKQRFDASPEELRQSVNSICDEGERLSARVEGIVVDTFGDTIDREMLSDELRAELDGKAEQTALAAEQAAREATDAELRARLDAHDTQILPKCEAYAGTYVGGGSVKTDIDLGFKPAAVLVSDEYGYFHDGGNRNCGGLCLPGQRNSVISITDNGFYAVAGSYGNLENKTYYYIAFHITQA